jgi:flagellar hook-associated protein 1
MGSLFTAMGNTAEAMRVMQRAVGVVQNNIVNASTAGYARQDQRLIANPFNPGSAMSGGVSAGPMDSTRNAFTESAVWKLQHRSGYAGELRSQLTQVERSLPVGSNAGISAAVDSFFSAVSQWSVAPNSTVARAQVLDRARKTAQAFNQTAFELGDAAGKASADITSTVDKINQLAGEIQSLNQQRRLNFRSADDAGLDAQLHARLEEFSKYAEFTALHQEDGTVSLYLSGRTPLVIGERMWPVSLAASGGQLQVLDGTGTDITAQLAGGRIGGLLELANTLLPQWQADLNSLATNFADGVNNILAGGIDTNGNPPAQGLFAYNPSPGAAFTIAVTSLTASELAGAAAGDPGGNTNALALAQLAYQTSGGLTLAQQYGRLASAVGDRLATAKSNESLQKQLLQQANALRAEVSGVDINTEAAKLLELQRGFQAVGQVMSVLNSLTETVLSIMR